MRHVHCLAMTLLVLLLVAGVALALDTCPKCGEKIESQRWNFCPYCGAKLDAAAAPPTITVPGAKVGYESVSWQKIVFERGKYHNHKVKFSARYTGIAHFFAPAERLGVTHANYVNFAVQGCRTLYVDKKKVKVIAKLQRIKPFTTVIIYGLVKVQKDTYGRGQDIYIVLVDDIDVE